MKNHLFKNTMIVAVIGLFLAGYIFAQDNAPVNTKEVKIKTSAQCDKCKARIEKAIGKIDGVAQCTVDVDSQILTVNYNPDKTNPDEIRTVVTKTGYDADDKQANPKAYKKLPKCCQKPQ